MNICHLVEFFLTVGLHEWKHLPCWKLKNTYSQGQCRQTLNGSKMSLICWTETINKCSSVGTTKDSSTFQHETPQHEIRTYLSCNGNTKQRIYYSLSLFSSSSCSFPLLHAIFKFCTSRLNYLLWDSKVSLYTEVVGTAGRRLCGQWFV